MTQHLASPSLSASGPLAGGGEHGALLQAFDWSSCPLSRVERWPQALKTAVRIDLLITDIVMPGISGRELGERLALEHPEVPVLYISGYTDDEVVRRGLLSAGAPFMAKPFDPDTVLSRVRGLLDDAMDGTKTGRMERRRGGWNEDGADEEHGASR